MSAAPQPRMARGTALAALFVVLAVLATAAILPHVWSLSLAEEIEQQTNAAVGHEAEARRLGVARQRLAALSNPAIARSMLLQGETSGLNGAQLQRRISDIALSTGINLQSLRISDPEDWKAGLRQISIEISLQAPLQQIQSFLYDIETDLPLLFIDQLTVQAPDSNGSTSALTPLDVSLSVRGLAQTEAAQ